MNYTYLVTGAFGHLGSTIIRHLSQSGHTVRGLALPTDTSSLFANDPNVTIYRGDVCSVDSLIPFFSDLPADTSNIVIHTAGIVSIENEVTPALQAVNVGGTANILSMCRSHPISRLVHVSSVHAIPEGSGYRSISEPSFLSVDAVSGGYAKTKAEATNLVLGATSEGLDAVVVYPSGILGPFDTGNNHLMQMVISYLNGKLPACVRGGYDFVDVRDVADGCIAAAEKGRKGESYLLSGHHYTIHELISVLKTVSEHKKFCPALAIGFVKGFLPFIRIDAKRRGKRALFTEYSLSVLHSNDRFCHDKATQELGYRPRDIYDTLTDTVAWLKEEGLIPQRIAKPSRKKTVHIRV